MVNNSVINEIKEEEYRVYQNSPQYFLDYHLNCEYCKKQGTRWFRDTSVVLCESADCFAKLANDTNRKFADDGEFETY